MQKLVVVERLFPLVVTGEKTSTIRFGEQRMQVGPMAYWCDGDSTRTVTVWVNRCSDMRLSEAAAFLGKTKEWPDAVMLEGMREHYSDIQLSDVVQIVEHYTPGDSLPYLAKTESTTSGNHHF